MKQIFKDKCTIAVHHGSQVSQAHNLRDSRAIKNQTHIIQNGHHETWYHESIKDAYKRIFDESVQEYNSKQKRKDRRISNYLSNVRKDKKKHVSYEFIVGVYKSDRSEEELKSILKSYFEEFKRRNANFEIIGAYYHNDEFGEPHLHIDYIPIANYERGMKKRTSLTKALEQMGFTGTKGNTAISIFQEQERQHLTRICNSHKLDVVRNISTHEHLETNQYKLQADIINARIRSNLSDLERIEDIEQTRLGYYKKSDVERLISANSKLTEANKLLEHKNETLQRQIQQILDSKPYTQIKALNEQNKELVHENTLLKRTIRQLTETLEKTQEKLNIIFNKYPKLKQLFKEKTYSRSR